MAEQKDKSYTFEHEGPVFASGGYAVVSATEIGFEARGERYDLTYMKKRYDKKTPEKNEQDAALFVSNHKLLRELGVPSEYLPETCLHLKPDTVLMSDLTESDKKLIITTNSNSRLEGMDHAASIDTDRLLQIFNTIADELFKASEKNIFIPRDVYFFAVTREELAAEHIQNIEFYFADVDDVQEFDWPKTRIYRQSILDLADAMERFIDITMTHTGAQQPTKELRQWRNSLIQRIDAGKINFS